MPGEEFSRDQPGPSARFRPGPGQLGEHAALQTAKPAAGGGGGRHSQRGAHRRTSDQSGRSGSLGLGLTQRPQETPDQRHLLYGLAHTNAKGLGRDLPFGLWAYHNGLYSELAPGKKFPDWMDG